MPKMIDFNVRVALPEDTSRRDVERYIREAVRGWAGGLRPEDPLHDIRDHPVTVRPLRARKRNISSNS